MKVLVCDPIGKAGKEMLLWAGHTITELKEAEKLVEIAPHYDALIVRSRTKVTGEVLAAGKNLKAVARAGSGLDNIDVEEAKKRGIKVISSPEALSNAVAELVVGFMLSLSRSIPAADRSMKDGKWIKKELMGKELSSKTVGIVGFGAIGKRVADLCLAFPASVIAYDVVPVPYDYIKKGVKQTDLNTLLQEADFITLHVPLVKETHHIINGKTLVLMKKTAFLINASRGEVVDEKALLAALKNGSLAGAALDVFEKEPPGPETLELIRLPNVIATPHIGGQTEEAQEKVSVIVAKKLLEALK